MNYSQVKQILSNHTAAYQECQDAIDKIKEHKLKQKALYRDFYQAQEKMKEQIKLMEQQDPQIAESMLHIQPSTSDILYQYKNSDQVHTQ